MGRITGGRFKREGIYVYLWLIHVEVCQKMTKFCKDIVVLKGKEINSQRSVDGALSFSGKMICTKSQLQCNNLSSKAVNK